MKTAPHTHNTLGILSFMFIVVFSNPTKAQILFRSPTMLTDIQTRAAQLNPPEKDIPEAEQLLFDESRRLDEEMRELRSARISDEDPQFMMQFDAMRNRVDTAISDAAKLDCEKAQSTQLRTITMSLSKVNQYIGRILFRLAEDTQPNPWTAPPWGMENRPKFDKSYCEELKIFIGGTEKQKELTSYLEKVRNLAAAEQKASEEVQKARNNLLELLQKRKAAVQAKVNSRSTQQQISASLWLVILVIGGLSVGAILAIKLFDSNIQMEWVASGQVIQFVTVMVLLSVIMALGLANILKENTLGTLLGGIAGYVLAQGVGRAAAREVSRRRDELPSNPAKEK